MNVLIAPDKFKDALDAHAVAEAIARGVRLARSDTTIEICPLADGGEGTGRLLAAMMHAEERTTDVLDPLSRPRTARWWRYSDRNRASDAAIIEMAEASGLWLLAPEQRRALETTSFGTGQLLAAVADAGCSKISLCVGGSATVDGGAGCLQGLGWRLLDSRGSEISESLAGGSLTRVVRIAPPRHGRPLDVEILCDVTNPLLGPDGAAAVFGPQKGATPAQVRALENALRHWAHVLSDFAGRDLHELPGAGAAGGLPFGLVAALEARLVPGFETVAECVRLREKIAAADLVLTGEGRLDAQTTGGKVAGGVARLCHTAGKSCVALVGAAETGEEHDLRSIAESLHLHDIVVITPPATPLSRALSTTTENLEHSAADWLKNNAM